MNTPEHARIMGVSNAGDEKVLISSADWMVRNIDHRIEAACPFLKKSIRQELKDILQIQLNDNIKARILDNALSNQCVNPVIPKNSQPCEVYNYLYRKQASLSQLTAR